MSTGDLHALPVGDPLVSLDAIRASDGMLIHNPSSGAVFVIRNGLKCWVTSPESMRQHGFDWAGLIDVGPAYMNGIPDGPAVPEMRLSVDATEDLGEGHYMRTVAHMTPGSSTLWATTSLTCTNKFIGFTGGVKPLYARANGDLISSGDIRQIGIDPPWWFGATHRDLDWQDASPPDTEQLAVIQFWAPKDRFGDIFAAVQDVAQKANQVADWLNKFCENYPALCDFARMAAA